MIKGKITRHDARIWALQLLYWFDLNPDGDIDSAIDEFWIQQWEIKDEEKRAEEVFPAPQKLPGNPARKVANDSIRNFTASIVKGVFAEKERIDAKLDSYLNNWSLYRLGTIERNILRIGAWEIDFEEGIPPAVAINEAVELAKNFCDRTAVRFINGVLDRYSKNQPSENGK